VLVEGLEIGELPDDLTSASKHVVLELVVFVEPKTHTHLLAAIEISCEAGMNAGELDLGSVVEEGAVVDEDVIRRAHPTQVIDMPRELDEVRVGHGRIELERFDARILLPVEPLALDPVRVVV